MIKNKSVINLVKLSLIDLNEYEFKLLMYILKEIKKCGIEANTDEENFTMHISADELISLLELSEEEIQTNYVDYKISLSALKLIKNNRHEIPLIKIKYIKENDIFIGYDIEMEKKSYCVFLKELDEDFFINLDNLCVDINKRKNFRKFVLMMLNTDYLKNSIKFNLSNFKEHFKSGMRIQEPEDKQFLRYCRDILRGLEQSNFITADWNVELEMNKDLDSDDLVNEYNYIIFNYKLRFYQFKNEKKIIDNERDNILKDTECSQLLEENLTKEILQKLGAPEEALSVYNMFKNIDALKSLYDINFENKYN